MVFFCQDLRRFQPVIQIQQAVFGCRLRLTESGEERLVRHAAKLDEPAIRIIGRRGNDSCVRISQCCFVFRWCKNGLKAETLNVIQLWIRLVALCNKATSRFQSLFYHDHWWSTLNSPFPRPYSPLRFTDICSKWILELRLM